jgi:hypothetical protein
MMGIIRIPEWKRIKGPIYPHDTETDIYLGSFKLWLETEDGTVKPRKYDMYFCEYGNLVARYGDMGNYSSGMAFVAQSQVLGFAYSTAVHWRRSPLTDLQKRKLERAYRYELIDEIERLIDQGRHHGSSVFELEQLLKYIRKLGPHGFGFGHDEELMEQERP